MNLEKVYRLSSDRLDKGEAMPEVFFSRQPKGDKKSLSVGYFICQLII